MSTVVRLRSHDTVLSLSDNLKMEIAFSWLLFITGDTINNEIQVYPRKAESSFMRISQGNAWRCIMNEYFVTVGISDFRMFLLEIGDVIKHQDRDTWHCVSVCFLEPFNCENVFESLNKPCGWSRYITLLLQMTTKWNQQAGIELWYSLCPKAVRQAEVTHCLSTMGRP